MDDVRIISTFAMIASGIFLLFAGLCWISPGILKLILWPYHTGLMDKKDPGEFSKKIAKYVAVFATGPAIGGLLGYIFGGIAGMILLSISIILAFTLMYRVMRKDSSGKSS